MPNRPLRDVELGAVGGVVTQVPLADPLELVAPDVRVSVQPTGEVFAAGHIGTHPRMRGNRPEHPPEALRGSQEDSTRRFVATAVAGSRQRKWLVPNEETVTSFLVSPLP